MISARRSRDANPFNRCGSTKIPPIPKMDFWKKNSNRKSRGGRGVEGEPIGNAAPFRMPEYFWVANFSTFQRHFVCALARWTKWRVPIFVRSESVVIFWSRFSPLTAKMRQKRIPCVPAQQQTPTGTRSTSTGEMFQNSFVTFTASKNRNRLMISTADEWIIQSITPTVGLSKSKFHSDPFWNRRHF